MDATDDVNDVFTTLGAVGVCGSALVLLSVVLKRWSSRPEVDKVTMATLDPSGSSPLDQMNQSSM